VSLRQGQVLNDIPRAKAQSATIAVFRDDDAPDNCGGPSPRTVPTGATQPATARQASDAVPPPRSLLLTIRPILFLLVAITLAVMIVPTSPVRVLATTSRWMASARAWSSRTFRSASAATKTNSRDIWGWCMDKVVMLWTSQGPSPRLDDIMRAV